MTNTNRCPQCNGPVEPVEDKLFRCPKCKMLTDCEDDGVVGYRNPETNASKKEEFEQRQRERLFRKHHDRRRQ